MTSGIGAWTQARDAAWHEQEYNPRLLVPDAPATYEAWPTRAAATRRRHPPLPEIRYGEHPREGAHGVLRGAATTTASVAWSEGAVTLTTLRVREALPVAPIAVAVGHALIRAAVED